MELADYLMAIEVLLMEVGFITPMEAVITVATTDAMYHALDRTVIPAITILTIATERISIIATAAIVTALHGIVSIELEIIIINPAIIGIVTIIGRDLIKKIGLSLESTASQINLARVTMV